MAMAQLPHSAFAPNGFRLNPRAPNQRILRCAKVDFTDYTQKDGILKQLKADNDGSSLSSFRSGVPREANNAKGLRSIKTLILDNYDSYTYNLFQILSVVNGAAPVVIRNDEISFAELRRLLYKERAFDNVVISPGPGTPTRPSDIGICMQLLEECPDIPVLGVCMGHQALGYAHGMRIFHAPQPVHGRLSQIQHMEHPLFNGIPSGPSFKVVRYHSLILDMDTLPPSLIATAWTLSETSVSALDNRMEMLSLSSGNSSKLLMGVSHRTWPHHGVQFHPESIATTYGRRLLENFGDITRRYWENNPSQYEANGAVKRSIDKHLKSVESSPLKLCFRKLDGILNNVGGSENIFRKIYGHVVNDTFWLDSSNLDQERTRFSYMGGRGGPLWQKMTYKLPNSVGQAVLRCKNSEGDVSHRTLSEGFFEFLNTETQRYACRTEEQEELPFEFHGGFVGYLGYELKCECTPLKNIHESPLPDAAFFMVDRFIAVDHVTGDVYIVAVCKDNKGAIEDNQMWVEETAQVVSGLRGSMKELLKPEDLNFSQNLQGNFTLLKSKEEYVKDVEKCLGYIQDGESYEICLTAQMKKKTPLTDFLGVYSVLRCTNPAPYAAWLHFGDEGPCVCSSSPERFLQLDRNGILEAKPIKGTVSRGESPEEDEMLRTQLQESEKDQAENLMIVDLLRNDLGRVCMPGSVHVPRLMAVESYSTVHTLVSTVRGKKRDDVTPVDCVRAAFPGGSMTGAPKLRTMEILDKLENSPRGIYSGAIGYFSLNGSFDLSIVIRTLVIQDGEVSIGAGGAIVTLSDPQSEYEEMLLKTKAPKRALHICETR